MFEHLDHHSRAFALVGRYLFSFSALESKLEHVLTKSVGLSTLQSFIFAKNMQFRSKVAVLRSLINAAIVDATKQKQFDRWLLKIAGIAEDRRIVAHEVFTPSEKSDGVKFLVIKASGKLNVPDIDWSIATFSSKVAEMDKMEKQLEEISKALSHDALIRALATIPLPKKGLGLQMEGGLAALLPSSNHDYSPLKTTRAKSPRRQKDRPRKE